MDLTEAFAPGAPGEDLAKTDFFDFVVSPPPHCTSGSGVTIDEESFLHRSCGRGIFIHQERHEEHEGARGEIHTGSFIKETNNNTLTALPPVSTITGSLSHHNAVRGCGVATSEQQVPLDQTECDYWPGDDGKEQTCNILLEDLNKYCWSHTNSQPDGVVVSSEPTHRNSACNERHQNTDGAIYTLTVLNNEANSMDALDCCKSPAAPSNDSWSLRPNLDLDAILSMEPSPAEQDHDVQNSVGDVSRNERYHVIATPSSQYTTDDSGFVESKDNRQNPTHVDNNNDWKLSDQNHLQEAVATNDSAESLLRSALQGKLYSGTTQIASPSSSQASSLSLSVTNSTGSIQLLQEQGQQQPQQSQQLHGEKFSQEQESIHGCTEEDLLLSQLETTTYRPGDYEKLKSIANEVVESYCNLEPVCNVSGTTTVMYTLDPASGSLGTITLPADLGQVGTVTVVTAAQQDLVQATTTSDITPTTTTTSNIQQMAPSRGTKAPKKYSRKPKGSSAGNANGNSGSCGNGASNGQASSGNGGSPGSLPRKERSLHYCSICSKGFKDKYSVNVHIRTHTGEKPFACSICGKSFRQKAHLAKHYQTHITQKPNVGSAGGSSASSNASNSSPTCPDVVTSTRSLPDSATPCNPSS